MNNPTAEEIIDAEFSSVEDQLLAKCNLNTLEWMTRTGELIKICYMEDKHLRNAAMYLAGFGYTKCHAHDTLRIGWLNAFRIEWERRMLKRNQSMSKIWVGVR